MSLLKQILAFPIYSKFLLFAYFLLLIFLEVFKNTSSRTFWVHRAMLESVQICELNLNGMNFTRDNGNFDTCLSKRITEMAV